LRGYVYECECVNGYDYGYEYLSVYEYGYVYECECVNGYDYGYD